MFFPDRNTERMMDMWMDMLSQIENDERSDVWNSKVQRVGTIEEKNDSITLTADLELSVHSDSVAFKVSTEDRNYDFGQSFDFELNPEGVKATFNNGVLDVTVMKIKPSEGKIIKIE